MRTSRLIRRTATAVPIGLALTTSAIVLAVSVGYFRFDPDGYFEPQRLTYLEHRALLYLHITGAVIALTVLIAQLLIGRRRGAGRSSRSSRLDSVPGSTAYPASPSTHRALGRVYAAAVAAGGAGGLGLSFIAHGGALARVGFACLAVLWLGTTTAGVLAARRHDRVGHRRWMIRSAALTFAAVTLRLYLGAYTAAHGGVTTDQAFADAYAVIAWLCWLPNLTFAWWWTRSRVHTPTAHAPQGRRFRAPEAPERLPRGA